MNSSGVTWYNATLVSVLLVILLLVFIITTLALRRTFRLQKDLDQLKIHHAREIEIARQEIYRRSLEQVSTEIHDNLGQQLSLIKINLSVAVSQPSIANREWLNKLFDMTSQLMVDMRHLAKNLYYNSLESVELPEAIQMELDRVNRAGDLSASLVINGIPAKLDQKATIILLRMFQESMNNIVTHSKATWSRITLDYMADQFVLEIADNGVGINAAIASSINTMVNRSTLIGATMNMTSEPGNGATIQICLPNNPIKPGK